MKRLIFLLCLCLLATPSAPAELLHTPEYDEDYYNFTGIYAREAYVLCQSLTVRESPDASAGVLDTLEYGDTFLTADSKDGWVSVCRESWKGWVRSEYVLVWPTYLVLEESARAYAYDDVAAPVVGLLEKGEKLAVIRSDPFWYLVSLRGAAAWIRRTDAVFSQEPPKFDLSRFLSLTKAELTWRQNGASRVFVLTEPAALAQFSALLMDAQDLKAAVAGCPFDVAALNLSLADGSQVTLDIAADSCMVFRINGRDYRYAASQRDYENGGPTSDLLFDLFGGRPTF